MTRFIEEQCAQERDQRPQNNGAAVEKPAQCYHQKKGQQEYQGKLAETKETILARPAKVDDAKQRDKEYESGIAPASGSLKKT